MLVKGQKWGELGTKQPWGEILGGGQQCVLPPSIHPDTKKPYTWEGDPSLPFVLIAEPDDFKFPAPLRKRSKPSKLIESEWETLKQLVAILGKELNHISGKEVYFSCPWHQPDLTASFSYNLATHKFSCFHGDGKLKGRGLDELKKQLGEEDKDNEEPENFLLCDRVSVPLAEPEMIFEDLWPARTIGLFTGDGGVGKTHLTLQLLVAIASGGEIEGTPFRCPKGRPVVYITQEDEADFIRGELLCQYPNLKTQTEVSRRIRIISTALQGKTLFLSNPDSLHYLTTNLPEGCVFVLDSWSTFILSNENDNTEILRNEIAGLRTIIKLKKASPLLIHHRPRRNSVTFYQASSRGATALPNSCRFHIMIENRGEELKLSFEKVSRGAPPDYLPLIFDEEQRLFVPGDLDRYVAAFEVGGELTTSQFMEKVGKDPKDKKQWKQALDILRQRSKSGVIEKVTEATRSQEAVWKRAK